MNPYQRFQALPNIAAAGLMLSVIAFYGPSARKILTEAVGQGDSMRWGALAAMGLVLLVVWAVLAGSVLPAILRMGVLRRVVLGRSYVEGSWIQAERGGPNGPRIAIVSLKPAQGGFLLSSATFTRSGEIESSLQSEFHKVSWPGISFKFRETQPADSGKPAEGLGEILFDMTGGAPHRFSGCLQLAGVDRKVKTDGVKLTSWRARRHLRSLEGRRDVIAKYWTAFFEGPIVKASQEESRKHTQKTESGSDILPRRRASDWRKSDTTPTADKIRKDFAATAD